MSGRQIARAVTGLTVLSFLSPAAGLLAEAVLAWRFGTSATVDGFRIGMLLVTLVQQLLVVSVLPNVIVPLLVRNDHGDAAAGWRLVVRLGWALSIPTAALTLLLYRWPGAVVAVLAPGLEGSGHDTAVFFVRYLGLSFLPILWTGLWASILYARGVFWITPAAQITGNLLFAAILTVGRDGSTTGPAIAALAGASVPVLLSWAGVRRFRPAHQTPTPAWRQQDLVRLARLTGPLLAGSAVAQIGGIIVNRELSTLSEGSIAAFGYAWKLLQIVAIPSAAIATVLFPRMVLSASRAAHGGYAPRALASAGVPGVTIGRALRITVFLIVPVTCVLFLSREPLVSLLLGRGRFGLDAVASTSRLFGLLVLGAPPTVLALLLTKAYYAGQDTSSPALVQAAGVGVLVLLAPLCTARAGDLGIALLLSGLSWLTCVGLMVHPAARAHVPPVATLRGVSLATCTITATSALAWWATSSLGPIRAVIGNIPTSLLAIGVGALVFVILTTRSGLPEFADVTRYLRWRGTALLRRCGVGA